MRTRSLRWRLTWVLLKAVSVAWLVWMSCQMWQQRSERTGLWDASLHVIADQILGSMPDGLERLPAPAPRAPQPGTRDWKMSFQVWVGGRNVVHSAAAPAEALKPDFRDGFATREIGGERWRVYSLTDPKRGIVVQVGRSKYQIIDEMRGWMAWSAMAAALLFVLFGIAVWVVIGRSLRPLTALRKTMLERKPLDLTPLQAPGLPSEFRPLVDAFNAQLERVDAAVQHERRFIADAAHELRTPLAVLTAHADLALRADTIEEKNAALQRLSAGVQRSARLSEQLLDLARLDAGADIPTLRPVLLSELVVLVVRDFETLARDRRQRVSLLSQPSTILGDVDQLGILLRNLIDNAVRYAGEDGQVSVSCLPAQRDGVHGVELRVADNGPGVAADDRGRIFDRFFRVPGQSAPGRAESGSGIGLSLVARIAQIHGARIEPCDGIDGRGFCIAVFFPAAPDPGA
ncbi:ATP-binding protein [Lysobacter silvisoli]|uniref:histidine kinase n=1 Tax=Lysobacter silvisoli TaxID=2293254 RepID=A0A371JY63_9GAMM|nr:ATP-binding protein [Lysobacter silvisoli]RDZ26598.1 HAMP domain-containing protein [Lysobacter silvisoli]